MGRQSPFPWKNDKIILKLHVIFVYQYVLKHIFFYHDQNNIRSSMYYRTVYFVIVNYFASCFCKMSRVFFDTMLKKTDKMALK